MNTDVGRGRSRHGGATASLQKNWSMRIALPSGSVSVM
jgi:hypothetical protein